jgi:hypothetical protein
MRWSWWCGLVLIVAACGKSQSKLVFHAPSEEGGAGAGAQGGTSSGTDGAGEAGTATGGTGAPAGGRSSAGGTKAAGTAGDGASSGTGAAGSAGSEPASGGRVSAGGTPGSAGESEAGAAGAPAEVCEGEYLACGCGCCGGTEPRTLCYYPDNGDRLARIESEDKGLAMSQSCESAGCGIGLSYVCCAMPEADATATYEVTSYIGGLDHVEIARTGSDGRCASIKLSRPGTDQDDYPLVVPADWTLEAPTEFACGQTTSKRWALGALGSISFGDSGACSVSFDATLFFLSETGTVDSVRFVGQDLAVPGFCP